MDKINSIESSKDLKVGQEIKIDKSKIYRRKNSNIEKFDFNDILIEPKRVTKIISRSNINVRYGAPKGSFGHLPIIAAPMDTVVNIGNLEHYMHQGISVCLPRGEFYEKHGNDGSKMIFNSYSLEEFFDLFIEEKKETYPSHVLIDTANGHMYDLSYVVKKTKEMYGNSMKLMVGNVANPHTYKILSESGADFIRIGIGNGGGCLTTQNTGIGYPMASLIKECYEISKTIPEKRRAKIVADGGMKDYSDIIKALAIGADYVMLGSIFNKALESSGRNYFLRIPVSNFIAKILFDLNLTVKKRFRGMSTKEVQKKWGNDKLKTSEGVVRIRKAEYTLSGWCENFKHYLRSAMSYTDSLDLESFIGKVKYNRITNESYKRFNK